MRVMGELLTASSRMRVTRGLRKMATAGRVPSVSGALMGPVQQAEGVRPLQHLIA